MGTLVRGTGGWRRKAGGADVRVVMSVRTGVRVARAFRGGTVFVMLTDKVGDIDEEQGNIGKMGTG